VFLSRYRGYLTCRLRRHAAAPRSARRASGRRDDRQGVGAHRSRRQKFFADLQLTDKEAAIADKVLNEIQRRSASCATSASTT
jgi:hypothetical protein